MLKTKALKNIEQYHLAFQKFLTISIYLEDSLNTLTAFHECCNNELIKFCVEKCEDCDDFNEMKEAIKDITIKNKQGSKISKFVLQIYAFVYQRIMDFPRGCFDYKTLTTNDLFDSVHKIINVKTHMHHSHVTGNIIGYAQEFCSAKVRENKDMLTCIVHNFFHFNIFFLLQGIRLLVWETKDINMGGKNLTNINYSTIRNVKCIDTKNII